MTTTGTSLLHRARRLGLLAVLALGLTSLAVATATPASAAAPANDNLAGAIALTPGVTVDSTTVDATREVGFETGSECDPDSTHTVWFRWTSPAGAQQPVSVQTLGGADGFDTVLGVWTKATATYPLTQVTCDDEAGRTGHLSRATFTPTASTTYYFQVGNFGGPDPFSDDPGPGAFKVRLTQPPNDDLADAATISMTEHTTTVTVDPTNASEEDDEPSLSQGDCSGSDNTLWYRITPEVDGQLVVATESAGAARDTVVAVSSGPAVAPAYGALSPIDCNDDISPGSNFFSSVSIAATAGSTYYVSVGFYTTSFSTKGPFAVTFTVPTVASPTGDDLADAVPLTDGIAVDSTTLGASLEPSETQQDDCAALNGTVWFTWTAPSNTAVRVQTLGGAAHFDSELSVWTSASETPAFPLDAVDCNDEAGTDHLSRVTFDASSGQTYYIALGSPQTPAADAPPRGPVQVRLRTLAAPANNDLDHAATLALGGAGEADSAVATTQTGEPAPSAGGCITIKKTIWYAYTPATTTAVTADTLQSDDFDTVLGVYSGPASNPTFAGLTPVTCNDDADGASGEARSSATFLAQAGTTYYLQAGSFRDEDDGVLHVSLTPYAASPSSTSLTATASGQTVTLAASVNSSPAASGSVEFFEGGTSLGTVPLGGGAATKVLSGVAFGHHSYRAVFKTADYHVAGSTSAQQSVDLVAPTPTQVVTATKLTVPKKVKAGKKATVTVAVTTASGAPAAGAVTVTVGGKSSTLTLVNGTATLTTGKLKKPGKITVTAAYAATTTTQASSTSATIKVTKKPKKT